MGWRQTLSSKLLQSRLCKDLEQINLSKKTYKDNRFRDEIIEDLEFMIENLHIAGFPDDDSIATYRNISLEKKDIIEPAEYYGLMICPLVEAYEQYGNRKYLEQAIGICNHIIRSSWVDENNQRRLHKMWYKAKDAWVKLDEPMLISGMAMSLLGINMCLQHIENDGFERFINECDKTYAYYQTKRGYFVSATGWKAEPDVAPCTAWQAHDFMYLAHRGSRIDEAFWDAFNSPYDKVSALLGDNCIWVEDNEYWAIKDYFSNGIYMVAGRKDTSKFVIDIGWVPCNRTVEERFKFKEAPVFVKKTAEGVYVVNEANRELDVDTILNMPVILK